MEPQRQHYGAQSDRLLVLGPPPQVHAGRLQGDLKLLWLTSVKIDKITNILHIITTMCTLLLILSFDSQSTAFLRQKHIT